MSEVILPDVASLADQLQHALSQIDEKEAMIATLLAEVEELSLSDVEQFNVAVSTPLPHPELGELQDEAAAEIERLVAILQRVRADRDDLKGQVEFLVLEAECGSEKAESMLKLATEKTALKHEVNQLQQDFESVLTEQEVHKATLRSNAASIMTLQDQVDTALEREKDLISRIGRREEQIARHQSEILLKDANIAALAENLEEMSEELKQSASEISNLNSMAQQERDSAAVEVQTLVEIIVEKINQGRKNATSAIILRNQIENLNKASELSQEKIGVLESQLEVIQSSERTLMAKVDQMKDKVDEHESMQKEIERLMAQNQVIKDMEIELEANKDQVKNLVSTQCEAVRRLEEMEEVNIKLENQVKAMTEDFDVSSAQQSRKIEKYKVMLAEDSALIRKLQAAPQPQQIIVPYVESIMNIRQRTFDLHKTMCSMPLDITKQPQDHTHAISDIFTMLSDWREWSDDLEPRLEQQAQVQDDLDDKYRETSKKLSALTNFSDRMKAHLKFKTEQCKALSAEIDALKLAQYQAVLNQHHTPETKTSSSLNSAKQIAEGTPHRYSVSSRKDWPSQQTQENAKETEGSSYVHTANGTSNAEIMARPELKKSRSMALMEKMNFSLNSPAPSKIMPSITPSSRKRVRNHEEPKLPGREAIMRLNDEENNIIIIPEKSQVISPILARYMQRSPNKSHTPMQNIRQPLSAVQAQTNPKISSAQKPLLMLNRMREGSTPKGEANLLPKSTNMLRVNQEASLTLGGIRDKMSALKSPYSSRQVT